MVSASISPARWLLLALAGCGRSYAAIWRARVLAAPGRGRLPEVGRGQDRRRRRADPADRRPRHVRRRFSAQGGGAGRELGHELCRRAAPARRNPQRILRADAALAGERAALCAAGAGAAGASRSQCTAEPMQRQTGAGPVDALGARTAAAIERPAEPRAPAGRPMSLYAAGRGAATTIFPTTPSCRPAAPRRVSAHAPAYNAPVYQPPQQQQQRALPPLGPMRGPQTTAAIMPAAVTPPATLACPLVSALDRWVSEGVQPAALRWFGAQVTEIKQISAYSCRGMVGSGTSQYFRARLRQCARHRRLHARRRPQDHGQGRLARHAGRAGLPARRAAFRLRDLQHGAGARLQRRALRPHPRRPDAARERAASVPAGCDPGRGGRRQGARGLCQQAARAGLYRLDRGEGRQAASRRSRFRARTAMSRMRMAMRR